METFIQSTLKTLLDQKIDWSKTTLVLPGKRPIVFFKEAFRELNYSGILPEFLTIEELIEGISKKQSIKGLELCFEFYQAYLKTVPEADSFEDFLKWYHIALKDYDDIDANTADPLLLFTYLSDVDRINQWGNGEDLDINQYELIKNHLVFWEQLKLAYSQLNLQLNKQNKGYKGALVRTAHAEKTKFIENTSRHFIFIGFNAFTQLEGEIVTALIKEKKAQIFWDTDAYYLNNRDQEAGTFLRAHKKNSILSNTFKTANTHLTETKNIHCIEVAKSVGQAKIAGQLLRDLPRNQMKTALVLADEFLLPAILNGLPSEIEKVNLTMGIPLKQVVFAHFFQRCFELHMNREKLGKGNSFYYKDILSIVQNAELSFSLTPDLKKLKNNIENKNWVFISVNQLKKELSNSLFSPLFSIPKSPYDFIGYLQDICLKLLEEETYSSLEKEYLRAFEQLFLQLQNQLEKNQKWISSYTTLHALYTSLLGTETIDSIGEPLEGLQVMGMLETRLLDFENLILTSVNEGILPLGKKENTFIPFDIRAEYGLNTFVDNDAIYAYHFYRLIQRAKNIYFLYSSESDGIGSSEKSRFISQLEIESPHTLIHHQAQTTFESQIEAPIEIRKTEVDLAKIKAYYSKGISASGINSYLWDPLEFYYKQVLGIYQNEEEVEENISNLTFGNVVHDSLEELYTPLIGKTLRLSDLEKLNEKADQVAQKYFISAVGNHLKGKNYLTNIIIKKMIHQVINYDLSEVRKGSNLLIKGLEISLEAPFETEKTAGIDLRLKGKIDRIDSLNETIRLLDYKTGKVTENDLKLTNKNLTNKLFKKKEFDKANQLLIYAYLWLHKEPNQAIELGIISTQNKRTYQPLSFEKETLFSPELIEKTKEQLADLLLEILEPSLPFIETIKDP